MFLMFYLFLDLWNVLSTLETKQLKDDSVSGKAFIWTTKVLKLGFWKEVQVISVFKNHNQLSSILPNLHKGGFVARKQYDFRVTFKELWHVLNETQFLSVSPWNYLKQFRVWNPCGDYWRISKFKICHDYLQLLLASYKNR